MKPVNRPWWIRKCKSPICTMSGPVSPLCPGAASKSSRAIPRDLHEAVMTHRPNHRDPIPSHSPWHPKSCRLLSFANDHGRPISQGRLLCNLDGSRSTNSCPAKLARGFPAGCPMTGWGLCSRRTNPLTPIHRCRVLWPRWCDGGDDG